MAKSLTCNYGEPWTGKTTFLSSVLRYGLERDPKFRARLYTCGNYDALLPWIEAGILECWVIDTRECPFDTVQQAVQGMWPDNPEDPSSRVRPPSPKDLEEIGAWFFEEMSSMCDFMMGGYAKGGLAARSGRNERIGPAEETISFYDGPDMELAPALRKKGIHVGGNPRTHYNVVQRWMHGAVKKSKSLPGHVIWTSHETVAKDKETGTLILGPELTGTAATPVAPRWFGNTLHAMRVDEKVKDKNGKEPRLVSEYRLYLKAHYSPHLTNIPHKAVMRVPAMVDQEEVDKIIPPYILNTRDSFAELMAIRESVDGLAEKLISEIKEKRRIA